MCIACSSRGAVIALEAVQQGIVSAAALVLRVPPIDAAQLAGVAATLIIVATRSLLLDDVVDAAAGCANVTAQKVEGAGHVFEEPCTLEIAVQITTLWLKETLHP